MTGAYKNIHSLNFKFKHPNLGGGDDKISDKIRLYALCKCTL